MAECFLSDFIQFCDYSAGGLKYLFLGNLSDVSSFDISVDGTISGINMQNGKDYYWFDSTGNWVEVSERKEDSSNGYFVTQTINFDFAKMENDKRLRIQELCRSNVFAITIDKNGKKFIYGQDKGLRLLNSSSNSGRRGGDFNGYRVTLEGLEKSFAREIDMTEAQIFSTALPPITPNAVINCAYFSAVTWGNSSYTNSFFGPLNNCTYNQFL